MIWRAIFIDSSFTVKITIHTIVKQTVMKIYLTRHWNQTMVIASAQRWLHWTKHGSIPSSNKIQIQPSLQKIKTSKIKIALKSSNGINQWKHSIWINQRKHNKQWTCTRVCGPGFWTKPKQKPVCSSPTEIPRLFLVWHCAPRWFCLLLHLSMDYEIDINNTSLFH